MFSCDGKKNNSTAFDRKPLLENFANRIIIPSYADFRNKLNLLSNAILEFNLENSVSKLQIAKQRWAETYIAWQHCNAFNFGPAGEDGITKSLVDEIGVFPVSVQKIEMAIENQTGFNNFDRDARGLLTLEYLLFDTMNNEVETVKKFSDNKRMRYLDTVCKHSLEKVNQIVEKWNGGYKTEFINSTGSDAGSSITLLYNEFLKSYEYLKNFKLAIPLGKRVGQIKTEPKNVEALYSKMGFIALREHFTSIVNIWYGRNNSGSFGLGFKDYLMAVEGGKELVQKIEVQIKTVQDLFMALPANSDLYLLIHSNTTLHLENIYVEILRTTRFFKSEMSSLLGIYITYSSGDGD